MKGGDEGPFPPADTTNDNARSRGGRNRPIGAMGLGEAERKRMELGSMIRRGMFLCGSHGRLAQPVNALTVSMIEPAFKAALMTAASFASLCGTSPEATGMTAIAMPPVTMGTDEEHGAATGRRTELLVEG